MKIPPQLQNNDFGFVKIPPKEKGPKTTAWQLDPRPWTEVSDWLDQGFNYGAMGGYGGLMIIDADKIEIKELVEANLPATFTTKSGRASTNGRHYYYLCPEIKNKFKLLNSAVPREGSNKLEKNYEYGQLTSYGAQVVGPGSTHPNGNKYEVVADLPITTISRELIFSVLGDYLPELLESKVENNTSDKEWKKTDDLKILDVLRSFGVATEYRGRQLQTSHPIHGSEGKMNFAVDPQKNVWACYRHDTGGGPMNLIAVLEGIIDCSEAIKGGLKGKRFMDTKDLAIKKYGLIDSASIGVVSSGVSQKQDIKEIYAQLKKDFFYEDKKGNIKVSPFGIQKIAEYFVQNYNLKTIGGEKYREIYIYKGGVYLEEGSSFFRAEIEKILEEADTISRANEILEKIKNLSYVERENFIAPKDLINLKNGVYSLKDGALLAHSPDYFFMHQIPVSFDPEADCPKIKKFFGEILNENDIITIQEWFGYSLYRQYFVKKALILHGTGNTGKTTLLRVLTRFIGANNIADISLQKIGSDKFAAAHLYNKHLDIHDDLSSTDVADNGPFKMVTGGGTISGEYKYGDQFIFENYAKLTFSCNKVPPPRDIDDNAYFARWIIIPFKNAIPEEKMDKFLLEKILTDEEMSGLLNWALEGLNRLLAGNDFSYKKSIDESKMEMLKSSSSIAEFVYNRLEKALGEWISKEKLYQMYVAFCDENDLSTEVKEQFGRDLPKYAGYIADSKGIEIVKQVTGWRNVRVKIEQESGVDIIDQISKTF